MSAPTRAMSGCLVLPVVPVIFLAGGTRPLPAKLVKFSCQNSSPRILARIDLAYVSWVEVTYRECAVFSTARWPSHIA
jgi:hypothetical protein